MPYATLDLILRTSIFTLAMAAAAAVLVRAKRGERGVPASLSALAIGGIGAFAVSSAPAALTKYGPVVLLFDAWCIATPAVIWILAQALFRENFRPGPAHWLLAGIYTAVTFAADWGRFRLGILGEAPRVAETILFAGRGAALVFVVAAGYAAIAHWRVDLVESRRRARGVFVTIIVVVFATLALSDFVFGPAGASAAWLVPGHLALIAIAFTLLLAVSRGAVDELFVALPPPVPTGLSIVDSRVTNGTATRAPGDRSRAITAALAGRVTEAMTARRLWEREGLGIAQLAAELRTQEYLLRRAINQHLGYRNFNDFLHDYRLQEAARRLESASDSVLPVLTIALDCGYGSIGPFNRAFKARFGVTPTQYRNLHRDQTSTKLEGRAVLTRTSG
jgi:AraC-like DNA-binding protein